ncbi:hypothetical protein WJX73_005422 [Symbiochloris irregularis]|uniref:Ricin B lectin domain-containing protein n=1 Tax=Symbiochloris irregularis TaxID=706552 RepID=A0AAW1NR09_9CHLO
MQPARHNSWQTRTDYMPIYPGVFFEQSGQNTGTVMIHMALIPTGEILLYSRPDNREYRPLLGAVYNLNNNTFKRLSMQDSAFCSAPIMLWDGNATIIGGDDSYDQPNDGYGDGRYNVRKFAPGASGTLTVVAQMHTARWYPSVLTLSDGRILIVSGVTLPGGPYAYTAPTGELYDPVANTVSQQSFMSIFNNATYATYNLYPFTTLLPNGLVMVIAGRLTRFYSISGNTITETAYKNIPLLPTMVSYPQTATIQVLPLVAPNYNVQVVVFGGSSVDNADNNSPASNLIQWIDLSQTSPTWVVERMASPRVMPDAVLLPDGNFAIFNGGEVGIAGSPYPGAGDATNPVGTARCAEMWFPGNTGAQRTSGLLADSQRDRLYHSQAWLTRNAEVIISGSEATEDYTMQIWTPPYLVGTFSRPLITAPSSISPGYGATLTFTLTWSAGSTGQSIKRVVFNIVNGITHSTHFDQRQVVVPYTVTNNGGTLSITTPPSNLIAPPGNYLPCPQTVSAYTSATPDVFQVNYNPTAPQGNTYDITSVKLQGKCNALLTAFNCPDNNYNSNISTTNIDDSHGLQQFTLTPTTGGYYMQVLQGRFYCGADNFASYINAAPSCTNPFVALSAASPNPTVWKLAPYTGANAAAPPLANGNYTITVPGRSNAGCAGGVGLPACGNGNDLVAGTSSVWQLQSLNNPAAPNLYNAINLGRTGCYNYLSSYLCSVSTTVTSYNQDDLSGRQQFNFVAVNGGFNIIEPTGRNGCPGQYVTAQTCAQGTGFSLAAAGTGLQVFTVTPTAAPTVQTPVLPNANYIISSNGRKGQCAPYMSLPACGAGDNVVLSAASRQYALTYLPNAPYPNTYQVADTTRGACFNLLSAFYCGVSTDLSSYNQDDGSGRQELQFIAVPGGGYQINMPMGREGCAGTYLTADFCATTNVTLSTYGSGFQTWSLTPTSTPLTPLANGLYTINVTSGRTGCAGSQWQVTALPNAPNPNTYLVQSLQRAGQCYDLLSSYICGNGYPTTLTTYNQDDGSGRQELQIIPTVGGYTINLPVGRQGCPQNQLTALSCTGGNSLNFGAATAGANIFGFTPVTGGSSSPLATGYYTISSNGRTGCAATQYLAGPSCANGNAPTLNTADAFYVSYISGGTYAGTYTIIEVSRSSGCANMLSSAACSNNALSFVSSDSSAGLTRFQLLQQSDGSYTIQCGASNDIGLSTGGVFALTYLPNAQYPNTYDITVPARANCWNYLSAYYCGYGDQLSTYNQDDGGGTQQFRLTPTGGGYIVDLPNGRNATTMATFARILPDGQYYINNVGGNACANYLNGSACASGDAVGLASSQASSTVTWTLTYATGAANINTYTLSCSGRSGCNTYLSAPACPATGLGFAGSDTGSGLQQWQITAAPSTGPSGYYINIPAARSGCTATYLGINGCGAGNAVLMSSQTNSNQIWSIVAVNPAAG